MSEVKRRLTPNLATLWLDRIWHIALPATILSLGGIAVQSRYIRASMLETLREGSDILTRWEIE